MDLLQSVGFRDVAPIEANGLTGADLLEVTEQELREELGLSHFQVGGCSSCAFSDAARASILQFDAHSATLIPELRC